MGTAEAPHISQAQADEFAVGALDPLSAAALREHTATCDACQAMVDASHRAAAVLLLGVPRSTPSPALKRKVLRSAGILRPGPITWAARIVTAGAGVAAVVVAVAAFTGMVSVRGQVRELRNENAALAAQLDVALATRVEIAALTQKLDEQQRLSADLRTSAGADRDLLLALLSAESSVAEVFSVGEMSIAIGRFIWDPGQQKVWFVASRLPKLENGQTYQLWVHADGSYRSLGSFNADQTGFARFETLVPQGIEEYDTAVVTIERPGAYERSGPSVFVADLSRLRE